MISGVATGTVGSAGASHSIAGSGVVTSAGGAVCSLLVSPHRLDVSPAVISVGCTRPGGAGSGWAVLTSLNATPSPPIAITAPAPIPADRQFDLIRFHGPPSPTAGRTLEQRAASSPLPSSVCRRTANRGRRQGGKADPRSKWDGSHP